MIVNGRNYGLWGQFVERKEEFIGGTLEETDGRETITTKITGIELKPNGDDSAFFQICGEDFSCGFDAQCGGVDGAHSGEGWIAFASVYGLSFKIKQKGDEDG